MGLPPPHAVASAAQVTTALLPAGEADDGDASFLREPLLPNDQSVRVEHGRPFVLF